MKVQAERNSRGGWQSERIELRSGRDEGGPILSGNRPTGCVGEKGERNCIQYQRDTELSLALSVMGE